MGFAANLTRRGRIPRGLWLRSSEHTFYRWRPKYGGMEVSDPRKLKVLLRGRCRARPRGGLPRSVQ